MSLAGRLAWAALGALLLYGILPLTPEPAYDRVIVPARAIEVREVPGEIRWRDRIVYRFVEAAQTAVAPAGGWDEVQTFCRPVVLVERGDTATAAPRRELVRSVTYSAPWVPLGSGRLFVSTVANDGDLLGRDYGVRGDFGLRAADSLLVRTPRPGLAKEAARGALWYGALRLIEAVVR